MAKQNTDETIIARGVRVEGDFQSEGNVVIEGEFTGTVKTAGDLRVGADAVIKADVSARSATVAGMIHGNVQIANRLELMESAKVTGDVRCEVLTVSPGAALNGNLAMNAQAAAAPAPVQEEES
jgi:cytoskeletal protein CcmA (bactofilin family)